MRDRSAPLTRADVATLSWDKMHGLLPALVQHSRTGEVLMLGYMNEEALDETLASGLVTFFSRSRNSFGKKARPAATSSTSAASSSTATPTPCSSSRNPAVRSVTLVPRAASKLGRPAPAGSRPFRRSSPSAPAQAIPPAIPASFSTKAQRG